MLTSGDSRTRAYVAGALVPIYDQIAPEWRSRWHHLIEHERRCTIAAAERIVELSTEDALAIILKGNGLLGFALNCAQSDDPAVRAEMLGILLEGRSQVLSDDIEEIIEYLIQDDATVVRAATLYQMLNSSDLRSEFPQRFQALLTDSSTYASLSRLVFYTNPTTDPAFDFSEEIEGLKQTNSRFLHNALVFHIAAQLPFLSSPWNDWLEQEIAKDEGDTCGIVNVAKWHHPSDDKTRPIFEPDWLLDYADPAQLIWYYPRMRRVRLSRAVITIRDLNELNMIYHLRQESPDLLEC